jgi:hypothetical protein
MSLHAKLSASGSDRWTKCTPSISFEAQFPESPNTPHSERGSFGHCKFENEIRSYLGQQVKALPKELLHYDSPELCEQVKVAVKFSIELIEKVRAETNTATIAVEQRVDFSKWVPEGFGTADLLIIADGTAFVIDLKLGQGIRVVAQDNSQLRLYSVGVLNTFGSLFEIDQIEMIIVQPPLSNVSRETLTTQELLTWVETEIAPKAKLAWAGEGEFVPGDHCRWCRGKAQCPARNESNLALARHDFAEPASMSDSEIAEVLVKAQHLHAWVRDLEEFAYSQAMAGRTWPGFKLVEARGSRKFKDVTAAAQVLIDAGISNDDIFERNLRSLTGLETKLGKNKFAQLLGDLVAKTNGKPTLVPVDDKRPEFYPLAAAAADFSNS